MQGTQLDDIKQKRAMRLMEHLHSSAQFEHLFDFLGKYRWEILRQLPNDPLPTFIHYEPCTRHQAWTKFWSQPEDQRGVLLSIRKEGSFEFETYDDGPDICPNIKSVLLQRSSL